MAGKDEMKSLKDLYVEQLKDLYSGEKQILEALPEMEEKASNQELKNAFKQHRSQTEKQVDRLERIFEDLEKKPGGHKCKGLEGIIEEGSEMLEKKGDGDTIDAGLIAAAQRVEHYEIAGYGTARTLARILGETDAVDLLQETLEEEKETDEKLTQLAERKVNREAQKTGAR